MIWDVVLLGAPHELDLLELRFRLLGYVPGLCHVVVESPRTFQDTSKPLVFGDARPLFGRWEGGIRYVVHRQVPSGPDHMAREAAQREAAWIAMADAADTDWLLISDADEIPHPSHVEALADGASDSRSGVGLLLMRQFFYWLNCEADAPHAPCACTRIASAGYVRERLGGSLQRLREKQLRDPDAHWGFTPGGWHFSYLGGPDTIRRKLASFAHADWVNDEILANVESAVREGHALNNRNVRYRFTEIDDTYPAPIASQPERWREYIRA